MQDRRAFAFVSTVCTENPDAGINNLTKTPCIFRIFCIFAPDLQVDMEQTANSVQSMTFEQLAQNIMTVDDSMRGLAVKTINQAITLRNWIIGCYIVEYEQNGSDRAKYGDRLLKSLEQHIGQKGLNVTLFQLSRLFYRDYPHVGTLVSANYATPSHNSPATGNLCDTVAQIVSAS